MRNYTTTYSLEKNTNLLFYKAESEKTTSILRVGWYDYGARNYDPQLGTWFNVDPMAEMYSSSSPYNYCMNDPVNNIDPNGMYVVKMATGGGIEGGGGAGGGGGCAPRGWGGNGGRDVYTPERDRRNSDSGSDYSANLGPALSPYTGPSGRDFDYWWNNYKGNGSADFTDWYTGVNEVQKAINNGSLTRTSFSAPDENGRIFSITESRGKFFAAAIITPIEYFEMPSDPGTMYAGPGALAQSTGDGNLSAKDEFNNGYDKAWDDAYNNAYARGSHEGFIGQKFHYPSSSSFPKSLRRSFWYLSNMNPNVSGQNSGYTDGNYFGYIHGYQFGKDQRNDFINDKGYAPWDSDVPYGRYDPVSPLMPEWYENIGWD